MLGRILGNFGTVLGKFHNYGGLQDNFPDEEEPKKVSNGKI